MNDISSKLKEIDEYPVPYFMAERISKLYNFPIHFSEGLIIEAKRMLYLCVLSDDNVAPSDRVDIAWHEMILFTKFYKDYTDHIGYFIHHIPNPPSIGFEKKENYFMILIEFYLKKIFHISSRGTDVYKKTKDNYKKYFNIDPNPLYWP